MLSISQLQQDFESLAREDALFEKYFKHTSGAPLQYLDRLEALLFENPQQLSSTCQGIPENISYFVNRICCYFVNNVGLDRHFKKEVYHLLNRLIGILEKASDQPEISGSLEPFFVKKNQLEHEPETPSAFDRLQTTLVKYQNLENNLEPTWQRKQRLGKRLARYPHLYGSYLLDGGGNASFKQTTHVRQTEHVKNYAVNLHRFLRQESSKDNNLDLTGGMTSLKQPEQTWQNPTQLSKDDLYKTITYYKKTEDVFKKISSEVSHRSRTSTLADTKLLIYKAIINIFPPHYQKAFLNQKLLVCLQGQEASFNEGMASPALIKMVIDYCFKMLVIDDDKNHFFFVDMISNMGTKRTLSILLQLIHCYPVDSFSRDPREQKQRLLIALEKRLAMLFKNYEDFDEKEMEWLIYFLENFNIASALQFDGLDLSGIRIPTPSAIAESGVKSH